MSRTARPISVLVIDDSAHNRRAITQILEAAQGIEVIDRASDGEEGLKKAIALRPDVITLDLEMPRMDGFAFLRLLMTTAPTPVIVISSYAHKADVFKALELGAFDFIAKGKKGHESTSALGLELVEKVRAVKWVRAERPTKATPVRGVAVAPAARPFVIAVGASTGGPPAVQRLLEAMASEPTSALLICQHMPAGFTQAFAERLDRLSGFSVKEAKDGDRILPGRAYIAPGGRHLEVSDVQGALVLRTPAPVGRDKAVPSVDRLFTSVAEVFGKQSFGVVLTGMGADGAAGAKAISEAGGEVWAEAESTAVVFGMPKEAIATGAVKRVLGLPELGPALAGLARKRREHPKGR